MADMQSRASWGPRPAPQATASRGSGWVGMVVFGGVMMFLLGGLHAMEGVVAIVKDDQYAVTRDGLVFSLSYTTWGWIHLLVSIAVIGTGIGVFLGQVWARVLGIVIVALSAVGSLAFLPAYPAWGIIVITFDILVIYALAAHGSEVADL